LASAVGELKKILVDFNTKYGATLSAVVSRVGTPIAWNVPQGMPVENFAALAATILGASEVIYTGIIVESKEGVLVVSGLGPKAFIAAMFPNADAQIDESMEAISQAVMGVLKA